ncbi:MAG: hypothetical protein A4E65_03692 [Syntrophorhabdus sp. PtaU1.Bin153]|nr:MAG: hypothetical protein A4E65_03692 [Syntrophorhabdus sp. PtaU1.Bin153]
MNNLLSAIMTKCSGTDLSTAVGGRIYLDEAPDSAEFPYVVFSIVSASPEDTFKDKLDDVLIQFSIFSTSRGATEITDIHGHLIALFDDAALSITGDTCVWCIRQNLVTMVDEITTPTGTETLKHWAVDYSIMVEK